ncbi:MAG: glycosyltransferase family 2 protein [Novosphingobium sp.]
MTVAMAAHNAAGFIAPAIRSVLRQTLGALELIVVDDCSSDDTCAVVSRIADEDARVRLERLAINRGPAGARNRALELARGAWFAVLDADDLYAPDRLERLVAAASREKADLIADNPVLFSNDPGDKPALFLPGPPLPGQISLQDYLRETLMFTPGGANYGYLKPMFRTQSLRAGGFAYQPALRIAEDDDLIVRLLLAGHRYWLEPSPTYGYRKHAGSISHRLSAANADAMVHQGRALAEAQPPSPVADLLNRRWQAFARAADYARLLDALKARDLAAAARLCLHDPRLFPMLTEPLAVRIPIIRAARRRRTRRDPAAEAALLAITRPEGLAT